MNDSTEKDMGNYNYCNGRRLNSFYLFLIVLFFGVAFPAYSQSNEESDLLKEETAEIDVVLKEKSGVVTMEGVVKIKKKNTDSFDWWGLFGYVLTVSLAGFAAWQAFMTWRLQYFTDKWYELMQFLHTHPGYMDDKKNKNYKNSFKTEQESWEYESIARMCIAYVDDLYFLKFRKQLDSWFVGTIPLLVGRHRQWFEDNEDSYDKKFYVYVIEKLNTIDSNKNK